MSDFDELRHWAQSQIDNSARPEVRPDIGVTVLQLLDFLSEVQQDASPGGSVADTSGQSLIDFSLLEKMRQANSQK